MNTPLAERIRPKKIDDFISQQHLVGEKGALTEHIKRGVIPSLIFWGPPGIGKTTLANIIANESKRPFYTLSAINSGVKDIRDVIERLNKAGAYLLQKILFCLLMRIIDLVSLNKILYYQLLKKDGLL